VSYSHRRAHRLKPSQGHGGKRATGVWVNSADEGKALGQESGLWDTFLGSIRKKKYLKRGDGNSTAGKVWEKADS